MPSSNTTYASEVNWDEPSQLAALKRGLVFRLKQDMIPVRPKPATPTECVELCNDMGTPVLHAGRSKKTPSAPVPLILHNQDRRSPQLLPTATSTSYYSYRQ